GLEAPQPQAPRRTFRAVLQIRLVDGALAVLQPGRAGRIGPQPELLVALVGVQPRGHPAAGVPAAAQLAAHAQPRAGAEAVGVRGGAAAGPGLGGDVAGAHVAAHLPGLLGLGAGGHESKSRPEQSASNGLEGYWG